MITDAGAKKPSKTIIFSYLQLSNVGCEIIIRGSITFLERALPDYDLRFVISSYHQDRDREIMQDLPQVEVISMLSWKRYLRAFLRQTGRFDKYWSPRFSSSVFARSDLFVSVGGDIYTIFDGELPDDWMGYEAFATRRGIPSIMFGANMEKFELLSEARRTLLIEHLDRFRLLAVRDAATKSYLGQHKVTSPTLVYPDPIYSLRPSTVVRPGKVKRIGFNLSPLSVKKFGEGLVDRYVKLISELVDQGYEFSFIPHVYSTDGDNDLDDRFIHHAIFDRLTVSRQKSITLCDDALGFHQVAAALSEVDLVIAARMHCCLNAVTLGKPVCFLAYSLKAKTMLDWLISETPYAAAAALYTSLPADDVSVDDVLALIAASERLGAAHPDGITVDLEPQLAASPIWGLMSEIAL